MEMIDYTGKLNNHKDYIKIIEMLELKTKYIKIVVIDGKKTNHIVDKFKDDIIKTDKVSEWWGTITKIKNNLYKINASKELFNYLREFETFTKYYPYGSNLKTHIRGEYSELTDFGIDDIAFYDKKDICLLCTTTHEGYIMINEKIINMNKK